MTTIQRTSQTGWQPRREIDLLQEQLLAVGRWTGARLAAEQAASAGAAGLSREMRLDVSRRLDVLRRQHEAVVAHTEQHMRDSAFSASASPQPRAVVVHRNAWFVDKVSSTLLAGGMRVVAQLDNGADAVGVVVVEQPDLLLVEDKLPMLNGDEVLRQVAQYAPSTIAAAQVSSDDAVPRLLGAGARAAFSRRIPPAEVARELAALLSTSA